MGMKFKNIEGNLRNKMEEWLASISDKSLRDKISDNLLISGGCIASMFLGEKVSDYDVYIQDREVLCKIAEYYGLSYFKGEDRDQLLADQNIDLYGENEEPLEDRFLSESVVFLRTLAPDQIKLRVPNGGKAYNPDGESKYQLKFVSPNAITLTDSVQIVFRFHGTAEQIHKNYDFVHATNYFTMGSGLVTNKEALHCLLSKELRYQGSLYPITSIVRVRKFLNRGWTITAGELVKMAFQVSQLDLTDVVVLSDQLIGVDVTYFQGLIEAVANKDKETILKEFNSMVDTIFNSYLERDSNHKHEGEVNL